MNALPVCGDKSIKNKMRTYDDKPSTIFRGFNVPEDGLEYDSLTIISIHSLLVYENTYYQ